VLRRVLVLDGSWGVLIQRHVRGEAAYRGERFRDHPRDVAGDPDLLNLTRPDAVLGIHRESFAAGADIAATNTFTATSIGQTDYGLEQHVYELNLAGPGLARQTADEVGGFVAGSLGPRNVTLSLSPQVEDAAYRAVTFDQVRDAYAEQVTALAEGGVDLLMIETASAAALEAGQWVVWVELDPPGGASPDPMLHAAKALAQAGVGWVDINDNPMARARMNALMAAVKIERECALTRRPRHGPEPRPARRRSRSGATHRGMHSPVRVPMTGPRITTDAQSRRTRGPVNASSAPDPRERSRSRNRSRIDHGDARHDRDESLRASRLRVCRASRL
jgi:hypothetical protein